MVKQHNSTKEKHEQFITQICNTNKVYGLVCDGGFATAKSIEFAYENKEPVNIICFWSEEDLASNCIHKNWSEFAVAEIRLASFIEQWCLGMNSDGFIVGTNFDKNMYGFEIEPLNLILEIVKELNSKKSKISFEQFENLKDLEIQISNAIHSKKQGQKK